MRFILTTLTLSVILSTIWNTNFSGTPEYNYIDYDKLNFTILSNKNVLTTKPTFIEVYDTCHTNLRVIISLASIKLIEDYGEHTMVTTYSSTYCIKNNYKRVKKKLLTGE